MNRIALLAAGCAALALAACDHPDAKRQRAAEALHVIAKLDCPASQGKLTQVSRAPDGLSCEYKGPGTEVTLRLVALNGGDASKALDPIEAELRPLVPHSKTDDAALDAAAASSENVDIKLPGVTIRANDAGAKIEAGGAHINASEDGAEVRVSRNVEVDGKKVETERITRRKRDNDISALLILASDKPTAGWNMVGYQAKGPIGGPIVVGVVKAKERSSDHEHDVFDDVDDLIRHNVGGRKAHVKID